MTAEPGVEKLIDIGGEDNSDTRVDMTASESVTDDKELETVKEELKKTKDQLNDALSEVAVAQVLQENLVSVERQKVALEEELATMQILLSEATQDSQSNVIDHLKKKYCDLKTENQDLKIQLNLLEHTGAAAAGGAQQLQRQLSSSAASSSSPSSGSKKNYTDTESLLGVTKNIAKRVKSSVQTAVNVQDKDMEDGMARAKEGAEVLREIVEPLEEQIVALKGKLRETDSLLQEYEKRQASSLLEMEAVAAWLVGGDKRAVEDKLIEEVGDGYSGGEGELFHAMLAARIGMLVQELETVRWEKEEVVKELEIERRKSAGYRENVERMQSVVSVSREQVSQIRSQLTDHQKEQLGAVMGQESGETVRVISAGEWEQILSRLENSQSESGSQTESSLDTEKLRQVTQERDHLRDNCDKYQEDLKSEAVFRREMETAWNMKSEEYKTQVADIEEKLRHAELAVSKVRLNL